MLVSGNVYKGKDEYYEVEKTFNQFGIDCVIFTIVDKRGSDGKVYFTKGSYTRRFCLDLYEFSKNTTLVEDCN